MRPCSKWPVLKSCEIKEGGQEMAVMALVYGKNFNNKNSVNFVLIPSEAGMRHEATQIGLEFCY